jgi:serine/threonine protein kinase
MIPHTNWARVLKKFDPEPELINLISQVLVYDVKKRLSPFQILKHPYFVSLSNPEYKKYT